MYTRVMDSYALFTWKL